MTRSPRRLAALLALVAFPVACADAPRDPVALLVAPEAKAALEVGSALPTLPELIRRNSAGGVATGDLARAEALWREAAALPGDRALAAQLRDQAYALAAQPLAAAMDSAALAAAQGRLERWIDLAGNVLRRAEFPDLAAALSDAHDNLVAARGAGARGDRATAMALTLRASDRLAETTPQAVAARLTAEDELALGALRQVPGRAGGDDSRRTIDRIDRLVRGAREALTAGRYEIAIRRAYYARQLLASEHALAGATAQ